MIRNISVKSLLMKSVLLATLALASCGGNSKQQVQSDEAGVPDSVIPVFDADKAFAHIEAQCAFGPRVPGTEAHTKAANYIAEAFSTLGLSVTEQRATVEAFNGDKLNMVNIIASYRPEATRRIMICAHWDSRPWADNDPDEANHKKPVMAANDGASGVAVMIEVATQIAKSNPEIGVDFVAFDAEDYGAPDEANIPDADRAATWCLGSQYWSARAVEQGYRPLYGILLDMVGGRDATFYREGFSQQYAPSVVDLVWGAASRAGYGKYFADSNGGYITDDHEAVNRIAGIPTIDIIPYYPNNMRSAFGDTWHTVNDTPENIDPATLKAVGQTLLRVIYETI